MNIKTLTALALIAYSFTFTLPSYATEKFESHDKESTAEDTFPDCQKLVSAFDVRGGMECFAKLTSSLKGQQENIVHSFEEKLSKNKSDFEKKIKAINKQQKNLVTAAFLSEKLSENKADFKKQIDGLLREQKIQQDMDEQDWHRTDHLKKFKINWDSSQASHFCSVDSTALRLQDLGDGDIAVINIKVKCYDGPDHYKEIIALPSPSRRISASVNHLSATRYKDGVLFDKYWRASYYDKFSPDEYRDDKVL